MRDVMNVNVRSGVLHACAICTPPRVARSDVPAHHETPAIAGRSACALLRRVAVPPCACAQATPGEAAPKRDRVCFTLSAPVRFPGIGLPGPARAVSRLARHGRPCRGGPRVGPPGHAQRTRPNTAQRGRPWAEPQGRTPLLGRDVCPRRARWPGRPPTAQAATWPNVRGVGGAGRTTGAGGCPDA